MYIYTHIYMYIALRVIQQNYQNNLGLKNGASVMSQTRVRVLSSYKINPSSILIEAF